MIIILKFKIKIKIKSRKNSQTKQKLIIYLTPSKGLNTEALCMWSLEGRKHKQENVQQQGHDHCIGQVN